MDVATWLYSWLVREAVVSQAGLRDQNPKPAPHKSMYHHTIHSPTWQVYEQTMVQLPKDLPNHGDQCEGLDLLEYSMIAIHRQRLFLL